MQNLDHKKTWPIFITFVLIVLLVVGYYCYKYYKDARDGKLSSNAVTTNIQSASSWKTYTNNSFGYTIKYHSNWIVNSSDESNGSIIIQDRQGNIYSQNEGVETPNKITGSFIEIDKMTKNSNETLLEYLQKNIDEGKWEEVIVGDNYKAYKLIEPTGLTTGSPEIYVSKDNTVIGLSLNVTISKDQADSMDIYNTMLSSFRFIDSSVSNWKTYSNNKYVYSFQYPKEWALVESSDKLNVSLYTPDMLKQKEDYEKENRGPGPSFETMTFHFYNSLTDLNVNNVSALLLEELIKNESTYTKISNTILGGNPAIDAMEGGISSWYTILSEKNSHIYKIAIEAVKKSDVTNDKEIMGIINSFQFTK